MIIIYTSNDASLLLSRPGERALRLLLLLLHAAAAWSKLLVLRLPLMTELNVPAEDYRRVIQLYVMFAIAVAVAFRLLGEAYIPDGKAAVASCKPWRRGLIYLHLQTISGRTEI